MSDSWITTKVKSKILSDSVSKGFDVSVMTTHGVVTLKGSLASQHAIDHVRNIARSVKGVRHVNTGELVVAGNRPPEQVRCFTGRPSVPPQNMQLQQSLEVHRWVR
ncbi:BON domain-containing protein (plasmid) [Burkholderia multivorans]|uniref:BON domain-containing protein n=1 Tax=Burkholderia multivorans TaxID=87883 RepID=UPI00207C3F6F|nr:BON domain-containing protein [Burkholderia multivorans]MCO1422815.1 BON domain-containing protein [Burkholderia multivorans]